MSVPRLFHASEGVRLLVGLVGLVGMARIGLVGMARIGLVGLEIGLAGRGVIEGPRGRLDGDLRFLHFFILRNAQGLGRLVCGKRGKRRLLEIEPPK